MRQFSKTTEKIMFCFVLVLQKVCWQHPAMFCLYILFSVQAKIQMLRTCCQILKRFHRGLFKSLGPYYFWFSSFEIQVKSGDLKTIQIWIHFFVLKKFTKLFVLKKNHKLFYFVFTSTLFDYVCSQNRISGGNWL